MEKPVSKISKEFEENKQVQDIAHKVSQYAKASPTLLFGKMLKYAGFNVSLKQQMSLLTGY